MHMKGREGHIARSRAAVWFIWCGLQMWTSLGRRGAKSGALSRDLLRSFQFNIHPFLKAVDMRLKRVSSISMLLNSVRQLPDHVAKFRWKNSGLAFTTAMHTILCVALRI
ncbi:hypothetical protein K469DRAFT_708482 [Zopfia rhizophila CBS 207.26]|uniref:Secreted protein n=1 Tax=Zopfia rhizophila CBS 207.26 TaxID=1314779 RepID=A0A6A6DYH1_9PEZI|nr:hypothetical protein K469DRAFT_708482 [Zopfia rhizophila CBS 207.26]